MMISPAGMAIASMTVMLWILWSDTVRKQRPAPILYAVRIALYLIVTGILVLNMVRHPHLFAGGTLVLGLVAAAVGVAGAVYFSRKLMRKA